MRRRNVASKDDGNANGSSQALESLKNFDVYNKVHDDYMQKTKSGGIVTVITSLILAVLFWTELNEFFTTEIIDSISVDTRINQKLSIGLNITFPHLRCDEISVDTVDSSGDNQVNVHGSIEKIALDSQGLPAPDYQAPTGDECQSCMEGEDEEHKCCNTCDELKAAYGAKDLGYFSILDKAPQCKNSIGCRIVGKVVVSKVGGNVHIALGHSTIRDGKHVHEFNMQDVSGGFNTSHEISHVSFGDQVDGVLAPLDGTMKIVKHGSYMFHYYIKLVPTVFTDHWGNEVYTNQYSVTDSSRNVQVRAGELSGLPGVFFVYDFCPFLMAKTETVKPWSYIFTSMCAIIGGVFTIASLLEMVVHSFICKFFGCNPTMAL